MKSEVVEYYTDTGMDYRAWSSRFNMHFGYWRWGLNPFRREPMLEEMNRQVTSGVQGEWILDLGCGLGATMRSLARARPETRVTGLTLVPWQVEHATQLNAKYGSRLRVERGSYLDLPFESESADGAYALESCCHAPGPEKPAFLSEMQRVLKPGARFAVADGFCKTADADQPSAFKKMVSWCCDGWALDCFPNLPLFLEKLSSLGFQEIEVRDISWNISPSVLHSPWLVVRFSLEKILKGEHLNEVRRRHLLSCFVSLLIGLHRRHFGYYLITGRKG